MNTAPVALALYVFTFFMAALFGATVVHAAIRARGGIKVRKPPQQRYCTECGSLLLPNETTATFDAVTGEPWREVWLECPKYKADKEKIEKEWAGSGASSVFGSTFPRTFFVPPPSKHARLYEQRRKVKGLPSDQSRS